MTKLPAAHGETAKDARIRATNEKDLTKQVLAFVLFLGSVFSIAVVAESSLARFEGGIGVMRVRLTGSALRLSLRLTLSEALTLEACRG
jgi:hypothetical protein